MWPPVGQSRVSLAFVWAWPEAREITRACWHLLPNTAACHRVLAGVDFVSVKEILGHRDSETTVRYAHLAPGHLREAVNRRDLAGTVTKI